jgi:hypothetical protein
MERQIAIAVTARQAGPILLSGSPEYSICRHFPFQVLSVDQCLTGTPSACKIVSSLQSGTA